MQSVHVIQNYFLSLFSVFSVILQASGDETFNVTFNVRPLFLPQHIQHGYSLKVRKQQWNRTD